MRKTSKVRTAFPQQVQLSADALSFFSCHLTAGSRLSRTQILQNKLQLPGHQQRCTWRGGGCSPRLTGLSLSHSSGRYSPRLKYKTKRLLKQLFPRLLSSRRLRLPLHLLSCSSPLSSTHHPPPLLSLSWSHVSPCSPPSCPPPPPSLLPHCPPLSS